MTLNHEPVGRLALSCTAFQGTSRLASGPLGDVALAVMRVQEQGLQDAVLIFNDGTGRLIDLDLSGTAEDVVARLGVPMPSKPGRYRRASEQSAGEQEAASGPGRPKLGVVSREVTLLPRQWEWLRAQPGGASATLRRLIDEARRETDPSIEVRVRREAAYHFLHAMAGDYPGYEEATRKLFAGDIEGFALQMAHWPQDIRDYAMALLRGTHKAHR